MAIIGELEILSIVKTGQTAAVTFHTFAGQQYNLPVIRHDFPLPKHSWSYTAAVMARYFDTQSQKLGNEFRDRTRQCPQICQFVADWFL